MRTADNDDDWLKGALVRFEGQSSGALLGRLARNVGGRLRLAVFGAAVLVAFAAPHAGTAREAVVRGANAFGERLTSSVREAGAKGARFVAASFRTDGADGPGPGLAYPPAPEMVDLAALAIAADFEDPRAVEAFRATVDAAGHCYGPDPDATGCRIEAPGVDFDMAAGTYLVGFDPETGATAGPGSEGLAGIQVGEVFDIDADLAAALADGGAFVDASLRRRR